MPGRSSVRPAGRCTVSPSRIQPRSHIGRCSIAYDGLPVGIGHRLGEEDRVLVGEQAQIGVETGLVGELHRPQALPVLEVLGDGERQPRPERSEGDVRHQVAAEARHPGRARVLDAGVVGAPLPSLVGRENLSASMDPDGYAVSQLDLGEADSRHVAVLDQAREQVQAAVRGATAGGVEHPHGLERVAGLGGHHDPEPGHRVGHVGGHPDRRAGHPFTPEPMSDAVKCFWKATKSRTAGAASTHAPARIAPYGLAARPATLLM